MRDFIGIGRCRFTHKISYRSFSEAKRRARLLEEPGDHLQAYRCRSCSHFHIGHKTRREVAE